MNGLPALKLEQEQNLDLYSSEKYTFTPTALHPIAWRSLLL